MSRKELFKGGFVPYEEYKRFNSEDLNVTMSMLKHGIMPDENDLNTLAEAVAEALKSNPAPTVTEPIKFTTTHP